MIAFRFGILASALLAVAAPGLPTPAESAKVVLDEAGRLGASFPDEAAQAVDAAGDSKAVWDSLKPHALLEVELNPEMRVKVAPGPAKAELVAGKSRAFVIRVDNTCGATARLKLTATDLASENGAAPDWLDVRIVNTERCPDRLSGAPVEYKLLLCTAKEPGRREARLGLDAGQGTQDLGFRGVADVLFRVRAE